MSRKIKNHRRQADFYSICIACPFGCCNGARPPLTLKRVKLIGNFLKANGHKIEKPFETRKYTFPRETQGGYCVFLDKPTRRCQVHPVKPETCVAGPVTFDINAKTRKIEWFLKRDNICPLAGPLHRDRIAFCNHLKSAKREIRRLVRDMDQEALRAILTIAEPDAFKIGEDPLESKVYEKLKPQEIMRGYH